MEQDFLAGDYCLRTKKRELLSAARKLGKRGVGEARASRSFSLSSCLSLLAEARPLSQHEKDEPTTEPDDGQWVGNDTHRRRAGADEHGTRRGSSERGRNDADTAAAAGAGCDARRDDATWCHTRDDATWSLTWDDAGICTQSCLDDYVLQ